MVSGYLIDIERKEIVVKLPTFKGFGIESEDSMANRNVHKGRDD